MKVNARPSALSCFLTVLSLAATACGASGIEGTYSNGGTVVLDIRSSGKADLSVMGEMEHCTWKASDSKLSVTCKGNSVDFVRHDDGSLSGPMFIGQLKKSK